MAQVCGEEPSSYVLSFIYCSACSLHTGPPSPESPASQKLDIPRNDRGVPVFPSVDTTKILPDALKAIVVQYFDAVWGIVLISLISCLVN